MTRCPSGKIVYITQTLAEDALIDAWIRNHYSIGKGPINVYQCDDCGNFHFTSKGLMNKQLESGLNSGQIARSRRAFELEQKLRRR
jgi:hypothetical protein